MPKQLITRSYFNGRYYEWDRRVFDSSTRERVSPGDSLILDTRRKRRNSTLSTRPKVYHGEYVQNGFIKRTISVEEFNEMIPIGFRALE